MLKVLVLQRLRFDVVLLAIGQGNRSSVNKQLFPVGLFNSLETIFCVSCVTHRIILGSLNSERHLA
jgi:hypothetical protein